MKTITIEPEQIEVASDASCCPPIATGVAAIGSEVTLEVYFRAYLESNDLCLMVLLFTLPHIAVVDLAAGGDEFLSFFAHADGESFFGLDILSVGVIANVLGDLHRAEVRAAH